ncbi:MAG: EFR1 family ferrodoxin [Clostridia bacterium]
MRIKIIVFSGTGNTWWAGERLKEELSLHHEVSMVSVERVKEEDMTDIREADLLVLGYPVYGSDMPKIMEDFIRLLPVASPTRDVAVFCTQMMFSGNGASFCAGILNDKGYVLIHAFHVNMPNNIPNLTSYSRERMGRIQEKAMGTIRRAAMNIHLGKGRKQGHTPWGSFLGLLQRPFYRRLFSRKRNDYLSIDPEKCIGCMRCVQICPTGNIVISEGKARMNGDCIWCTRCVNFCPRDAVLYLNRGITSKQYRGPEGFDPALVAYPKNLMDYID